MRLYTRLLVALGIGFALGIIITLGLEISTNYQSEYGVARNDGKPIGGDFIAFYVGGRLFASEPESLYDFDQQRRLRSGILGDADDTIGDLPFAYPPLVAVLVAPFAALPFRQAFLLWTLVGAAASLSSLTILVRASGASQIIPVPLLLLFSIGFVPYTVNTFVGGQASWIGVAVASLTLAALLRQRPYLAGALMSLSYYKPPLFLLLLIVLCLTQGRRFVLGFATGASILVGATFLAVGAGGVRDFLTTASRYTYGQELAEGLQLPPEQGMGLIALGVTVSSSMLLTLAILIPLAALICLLAVRRLRALSDQDRLLGLILGAIASLAFSVQLITYDLAILLVPMILAVKWHGSHGPFVRSFVLFPLAGFYLEFLLRQVSIGDVVLNGSAILFLAVLGTLSWAAWRQGTVEGDYPAALSRPPQNPTGDAL